MDFFRSFKNITDFAAVITLLATSLSNCLEEKLLGHRISAY